MNSEDLADKITELSELACERVTNIGHEQYVDVAEDGTESQLFETLPLEELEAMLEEELADVMAYTAMAYIRMKGIFIDMRALRDSE